MTNHFETSPDRGRIRGLVQSLKEMSLLGKLAAGGVAVNVPAVAMGVVEVATDTANEVTYDFLGLNGGAVLGITGVALYKRHQRNKPGERDFSRHKEFNPTYTHTAEDGTVHDSPFPVTMVGVRNEFLGVGRLIGGIGKGNEATPVIAIQDEYAKNGQVELLGSECWWLPVDEEVTDALVTERARLMITPARYYVRTLDPNA